MSLLKDQITLKKSGKNLIVVVGPTAVGKTATAITLAQHFCTEIISADSRQIYNEMRIGTAVPSNEELAMAKHHFIQTKSIFEYYNAGLFEGDVLERLNTLFEIYDTVIMVGGSTLYVDAVCYSIDDLPRVDPELRSDLMTKYNEGGLDFLRNQLKILDPQHYNNVDLRNPARMLKAIEVSLTTGKPYSSFLTATRKERDFNIVKIGLNLDRSELFDRINLRVDAMVAEGLVSEAESLAYAREQTALKTVGYREIFDYMDGKTSLNAAIEQIKTNTRRYAKRQLTWFNRYKDMAWFSPRDIDSVIAHINNCLDLHHHLPL